MRDTIRLRLHGGELCVRPQQVLLRALQLRRGVFRPCIRALQVCAQVTHLFYYHRNVNSNGAS